MRLRKDCCPKFKQILTIEDVTPIKFLTDRTLGKLCRKLRALGFDVLYWSAGPTAEAARIAQREDRCLLTRSHKLPEEIAGLKFIIIEENDPRKQIAELFSKLSLKLQEENILSRCLLCNELLEPLPKEEVEGKVPDFIFRLYDSFHSCPRCQRIYWPGTHWEKMKKELAKILNDHVKME